MRHTRFSLYDAADDEEEKGKTTITALSTVVCVPILLG
jgi:hypothetical protein